MNRVLQCLNLLTSNTQNIPKTLSCPRSLRRQTRTAPDRTRQTMPYDAPYARRPSNSQVGFVLIALKLTVRSHVLRAGPGLIQVVQSTRTSAIIARGNR